MGPGKVHPLVWGYILFCLVSLVLGLGWLEVALPGGFPLGTIATWAMLILLATALTRLAPRLTRRRQGSLLGVLLAVSWYPVSIFQAGNVTLTFSGDSLPWLVWTGVIAVWLLSTGLWTAISAILRTRK